MSQESGLEVATTIDAFLAKVERRAYRMALLSTKRSADALDVVQEAMLKLVENYRTRHYQEWPLLFQRILQNKIMDWHRQEVKQRRWFWSAVVNDDEDVEDMNVMAQFVDEQERNPAELLARARDIDRVLVMLETLPIRQRQAFMLRAWEGFDVAETAEIMECSQGSVKTHYFRALQSMRESLSE